MADTMQLVEWCLEYTCPLRTGVTVSDPDAALVALQQVRICAEYENAPRENFGLFGNVCVTGYTLAVDEAGESLACCYPTSGFKVAEAFAERGGYEGIAKMCAECPANPHPHDPAGCTGSLYLEPDSEELEEALKRILADPELAAAHREHFLVTRPRWFGLWARSPLSAPALAVLQKILGGLNQHHQEVIGNQRLELIALLRAVYHAATEGVALHVTLPPPGHTDFGFYTIFPHCPVCRAATPRELYVAGRAHVCTVCGERYVPSETGRIERMKSSNDWDLREKLGQEAYEAFAKFYLVEKGAPAAQAETIVRAMENDHRKRVAERQAMEDLIADRAHFIRDELCRGLTLGHLEGAEDRPVKMRFRAAEFERLLARSREVGVTINCVTHELQPGQRTHDRIVINTEPETIFTELRAAGCDGFFYADFYLPDDVVEAARVKLAAME